MVDIVQVIEWEHFNYLVAVTIIILTLVIAKIILYTFERYLEPFVAKNKTKIYSLIIETIKIPTYIISLLLGIYLALWYVEFAWLAQFQLVSMIVGVILVTMVAYTIIPALIEEYDHHIAEKKKTRVTSAMIFITSKVVKIFLIIFGIMMVLSLLGVDITLMLAGMGIAGLVIALALQDSLSNMFSGFSLMFDQPFKIGDSLKLATGELCEVRDIGMRSTKLYNVLDNTLITIPNTELSKMKIVNISEPDIKLKVSFPIRVDYDSDINKVKTVLLKITKESPDILNDPPPEVFFMGFADFSLNLLLITWIDDARKQFTVTDYLNCRIKERFEEENIEIPRTIYMKDSK